MSSPLAIASVTYVLKDLLNNGLIDGNVSGAVEGNVEVSSLPPDRIESGDTSEKTQLNLFMYLITPNIGWRNQNYPAFNSRGERISNPPLAIDLHYLLMAYGSKELEAEILLGYGMQILHEHPVLTSQDIRWSLASASVNDDGDSDDNDIQYLPLALRNLAASGLAEQFENVKITPETLNTEEISRLWTAFGSKYRPFAAYMATVVLIESSKATRVPLPVKKPLLYVQPFRRPVIESIRSRATSEEPIIARQKIVADYQLVIKGRDLMGDITSVLLGGIPVESSEFISGQANQVILGIPLGLPAGIHGVQVVHKTLMGNPPLPHEGTISNIEAFVLSPNIEGEVVLNANATISLTLRPAAKDGQRIALLLDPILSEASSTPQKPHRLAEWSLSSSSAESSTFEFKAGEVSEGKYLVRVQVDGAESPVSQNEEGAPYNMPFVVIQ